MCPSTQQSLISALQPLSADEKCGKVMRRECDRVIGALEEGERKEGEEGRGKVKKRRRTRKWTCKMLMFCLIIHVHVYIAQTCDSHVTIRQDDDVESDTFSAISCICVSSSSASSSSRHCWPPLLVALPRGWQHLSLRVQWVEQNEWLTVDKDWGISIKQDTFGCPKHPVCVHYNPWKIRTPH